MANGVIKHASPLLLQRGVRGMAGQPMEIVVHLPTAPAVSAAGFEFDSAFPGAALLSAIPSLIQAAVARPEARLMVFGHADEAGDEDHNKKLSDRRAQAALAVLTQDVALFDKVARDDGWKLLQYQAMMAALGIAPMDVDGKPGPKTTKGVKAFQRGYNAGDYHHPGQRKRAHRELKVDGALGPKTESALRDAYLAQVHGQLDAARFMGPKAAGCGEFNRIGTPERDRRAVLALYRPDFPTASKIPCTEGDAASCKLNRETSHLLKCNFYRRTLESETPLAGPLPVARRKVLVQTVDELGYRLAHQPLVFVDEAGLETHAATNNKGIFAGYVQTSGSALSVRTSDGQTREMWSGAFQQPHVTDLVVFGHSAETAAVLRDQVILTSVYDRTVPEARRAGRLDFVEGVGEQWAEISRRTEKP